MKFPTDAMAQHSLFIAAFCDDLLNAPQTGKIATPRANRIAEIVRQSSRSVEQPNKRSATN